MRADERELGDRLAKGDREALSALYSLHASVVFAVVLRLLRDRAEAEELVQETFLEAWRRARQYQPERAHVAAWLITIAKSRAVDRLRSRGSSIRTLEIERQEEHEPNRSTDEVVDAVRIRGAVRNTVAQLPKEQRAVLELAWDEGLSQSEIATRTGLPLGTVKTRTRTALLSLNASLKSMGLGPG